MSNPESVNKLVKSLHELAGEADNVSGGAYGLTNLNGGIISGGRKRKPKPKSRRGGFGTSVGYKKNTGAQDWVSRIMAYREKHGVSLKEAMIALKGK